MKSRFPNGPEWCQEAESRMWGTHLDWLKSKGFADRHARSIIGRVWKRTGDVVRADMAFGAVKDRNPDKGLVVAFLMQVTKASSQPE